MAENELFLVGSKGDAQRLDAEAERYSRTREKLRQLLKDGQLENREVEVEGTPPGPMIDVFSTPRYHYDIIENLDAHVVDAGQCFERPGRGAGADANRFGLIAGLH